jgi:hypothetical protein
MIHPHLPLQRDKVKDVRHILVCNNATMHRFTLDSSETSFRQKVHGRETVSDSTVNSESVQPRSLSCGEKLIHTTCGEARSVWIGGVIGALAIQIHQLDGPNVSPSGIVLYATPAKSAVLV